MHPSDSSIDSLRLDGNAAAGLLAEIFALDATIARVTCVGCGSADSVGALHMYAQEMGAVLRCTHCECVVLRATRTPTHVWLDATGARAIAIPIARAPAS
jgi:uncharacterized protein DUF6510